MAQAIIVTLLIFTLGYFCGSMDTERELKRKQIKELLHQAVEASRIKQ